MKRVSLFAILLIVLFASFATTSASAEEDTLFHHSVTWTEKGMYYIEDNPNDLFGTDILRMDTEGNIFPVTRTEGVRELDYSVTKDGKFMVITRAASTGEYELCYKSPDSFNPACSLLPTDYAAEFSISPDGQFFAFGKGSSLYLLQAEQRLEFAKPVSVSCSWPGCLWPEQIAWSPDGKQIVYVGSDEKGAGIFLLDLETERTTRLTPTSLVGAGYPAWSPDGKQLAFANYDGGVENFDLYLMNADGTDLRRLTNTPNTSEHSPSWSPTGDRIAFTYYWEEKISGETRAFTEIVTIKPDGTDPFCVTCPPVRTVRGE